MSTIREFEPAPPYKVQYYDKDGTKKTIRRVPPPRLTDLMAGDEVTIKSKKNEDWFEGKDVTIQSVNPRYPNTFKVEDDDGKTTFLSHLDVRFDGEHYVDPVELEMYNREKDPLGSKYLLWP